ncbi:acid phosphatase (class A) [Alteromonadaceae bacterium 2753L.S.0a.02]|nr:acid phosphatase (class A) [Alteromonadaceae bacterium 2753L.S.0a.02]
MPNLRQIVILGALVLVAACASTTPVAQRPPTSIETVGLVKEGLSLPKGYLDPTDLPDSLALLPAPPQPGSAAMAADQAAFEQAMKASANRQQVARDDADLDWKAQASSFEAILGTSLSDGSKPHTEMLLRRAMVDAGLSTYRAKKHYKRTRPFVVNRVGTCLPEQEDMLRQDGSYPSGHTAFGWMLALVLTDLVPEKQNELLKRGYDYGQSRVVCRAHWLSDTTAARMMASATFARLQSNPVFIAQRELARQELAKTK